MCGIFGYVGRKTDAAEKVLAGLKELEYRGYDSWGIAVASVSDLVVKKRVGKIGTASVSDLPSSSFGLGHTRWATHGGVTQVNAHPHLDCKKRIAVVHNGIIENYEEIKRDLTANHHFISETDSEVAVHAIEENLKKYPFREAVRKAFLSFTGLNAIIVMDSQTESFVAVKSGSPLVVGLGKGENFIASDAPALLPHTRSVHFLNDFELVEETKDTVRLFDAKTGKEKQLIAEKLDWKIQDTKKGRYAHFMLKEINEQPSVIRNITKTQGPVIKNLAHAIKQAYGTYLTGCGTASYACLAGTYFFSKIAKRHVNFAVGSEFGYLTDFLTKKSLVIALSQSGETIDIVDSVKKAKEKKATIAALVNVLGSTLYRMSDIPVMILAGPEKAVASTKAFSAKIAILLLVAYQLDKDLATGISLLEKAAHHMSGILSDSYQGDIKLLARKIKNSQHMYVIGRGVSYPLAMETALKIKEISYIHAEGLPAGELKHGPIALITDNTPAIVFAPNDETYGANLAGAMEMKARGAYIIGISHKPSDVFDTYFHVSDCGEATILPNVLIAQLLAYYLAVERGLNPDMPRNLAKSVTVK